MANTIIEFFRDLLNNDILTIFIISMIPIVELRGAIPVAIEMGLSWYEAFGYAFLGSLIVAPILLLILMPILKAMKKIKAFRWLANAVEELFKSKAESVKNKAKNADSKKREDIIKMVGVFLFVAIPLPLTGVWTGAAVAVFLGLGFWKSLASVALGNVSAGLIMTGLSLLFKDNLDLFLTIFFIVVLVVLVLNIVYIIVKSHLKKKKAQKADGSQNGDNSALSDGVNAEINGHESNKNIENSEAGASSCNKENVPLNNSEDDSVNIRTISASQVKNDDIEDKKN